VVFSDDASPGLADSWKGGRSSRGLMTHWSTADDRDGLHLQDQCLGWGARERSAPPVYDNDDDDDGGLDDSGSDYGSDCGSDSDSEGGAPPVVITST
jgi:hypothetical protein